MDYGRILKRALQITWKYKLLWLFGLLAGFNAPSFRSSVQYTEPLPPEAQRAIAEFVQGPYFVPLLMVLVFLSLATGIAMGLVNAAGHSALIDLVNRLEVGEKVTLSAGWKAIRRNTWRVFLVNFLLWLPAGLLIMASVLPLLIPMFQAIRKGFTDIPGPSVETGLYFVFCGVCLGILTGALLELLALMAERACVLENLPVGKSIARGWEYFTRHMGQMILLGLILLAIAIGIGLVTGAPMCLLSLALVAPLAVLGRDHILAALPLLCGIGLLLWLLTVAINSVIQTFYSSCWTLFYRELGGQAVSVTSVTVEEL
jgi:hypothetical protein